MFTVLALILAVGSYGLTKCEINGASITPMLWPMPSDCSAGFQTLSLSASFSISSTSTPTPLLSRAFQRYLGYIMGDGEVDGGMKGVNDGEIDELKVVVADMNTPLSVGVNESYSLTVTVSGAAVLEAGTTWGALRGLESFSQLVSRSGGKLQVGGVPLWISDVPRYGYRGLMLDTARHYLPVSVLERQIDAVSAARGNVVHLHLTDAQSFPLEVPSTHLSRGAYAPSLTYNASTLSSLADYALDRGILLIPELDTPGHAFSWGVGNASYTANCPDYAHNINNIPLTPYDTTLEAARLAQQTAVSSLKSEWIHIGGDEVVEGCWEEDTGVEAWVASNHPSWSKPWGARLYADLVQRLEGVVPSGVKTIVHWNDVWDAGVQVSGKVVFEAWKGGATAAILNGDHSAKVLYAEETAYYLNCGVNPICAFIPFADVYTAEPTKGVTASNGPERILGGEAVMFGEYANEGSVEAQIWPRAIAALERMWSPKEVNDAVAATPRAQTWACRMRHRMNLQFIPLQPDYCE